MTCAPNIFSIFTGDAKTMSLRALYQESGQPLDLTAATEIIVRLPNADGTTLLLKLTLGAVSITSPAVLGNFTALITALQSALLNIGEGQSFDVTFTISGNPFTVRYYAALSVFEQE